MGKKPTTASEYRARAQAARASGPTEIVELKSGNVFELRQPDLKAMFMVGRIPQSLVAQGMAAWKASGKVTPESAAKMLGDQDVIDGLVFMRDIVSDVTVNPHFVEYATQENEIGAADMLGEDFEEIFAWAMGHQGVPGHEGLETFRQGRERGASGDSSNGAELQSTPEPVSAD